MTRNGVSTVNNGSHDADRSAAVGERTPQTDRLQRCSDWIRAWSPGVPLRWCARHRAITVLVVIGLLLILGAARAWADPGTGESADAGNVLISWMGIKDSDGVPVAKYTLTLNQGGWDDPASTMFAKVASISYEIYLCVTATALWLIKFVLDFQWMGLFTVPFETIGNGVNSAMDRFGLAATALAVLAIVVVCTALAGRTAKAFSNIAMGMLMIGVAATIFANPLAELVGPNGLLAQGRDTGLEIASTVSGGGVRQGGGGANIDDTVSKLADRFLRSPTQMINFGTVADSVSRECRKAWSQGINNERGDKLKDDIKGCDKDKGEAMHQKSMGNPAAIMVPLAICGFLAAFLVAFACYFVWHVVKAAVQAMLYAALAPPAFAIGVIPGGPQTFAWKTVLDCAMAYAAMIIYTAAFGAYNVILDQVFKESSNAIQSLFLTALVLAFGFALIGPLRRMFDRQRDTMAAKLGGGALGGRGGRGLLGKTADLARVRQELGHQFGWDDLRRDSRRGPGRIETETDSSTSSGGGDGGGDGGPSAPVSVGDPAAGAPAADGGGHSSAAGDPSDAEAAPDSGGGRRAPAPEPAYAGSDNGRVKDTLDAAIRLSRAARGGAGGAGAAGTHRHALSEAA